MRGAARRVAMAAQNALEIVRAGSLAEPYSASFDVAHEQASYRLRRYHGTRVAREQAGSPLLLVPPLMVASEVYDIAQDISAVGALVREGVDVWLTDYGAPEREEGGLDRTLDDHVLAVCDAVARIKAATGRDVHLAGYSQGGMFVYQAAAYLRSDGVASLITFGSPVDLHRGVGNVSDALAERLVGGLRVALGFPIEHVDRLPGTFTSTVFKLLSARKEAGQLVDFVRKLHDRQALEKRESKRLFLRGRGFVAWPGPAFRQFVDELVVANRMTSGGFVIDGRPVTLADLRCPILYFVGERDDMARPAAVRAIRRAAPEAEIHEVRVKAGHFGLVVGTAALERTWPTVVAWLRWRDGVGPRPPAIPSPAPMEASSDPHDLEAFDETAIDFDLAFDVLSKAASAAWGRVGELSQDVDDSLDRLRYQLPRLMRLRSIEPGTRVSLGLELERQARAAPDDTFFLWRGRAFSYAVANGRVDNVVKGLVACRVRPSQRVGVMMRGRPSYLSAVTALNRLGAVAVLLAPADDDDELRRAIDRAEVGVLIADPDHAARARELFDGDVLVLGGGAERRLRDDVIDMEAIDPAAVTLPGWYAANPGRARDLAMIVVGGGPGGEPRLSRVSNHRWAFSALGAAAACTLTSRDTVYACLPLHHVTGTMVAAGGALVGGSRLALASELSPDTFWTEVRRYGASVVFYAGEMCRALVDAPHARGEHGHPVRLFAGSGMRADVWRRLVERFGPVGVMEFYASTEANAVLANASGEKLGSLGRPMPGTRELALVAFDVDASEIVRAVDGRCVACGPGQPGVLLAEVRDDRSGPRVLRDVFESGDRWYATGDLLRRDDDGDYWYVDRIADLIDTPRGKVGPRAIEDALYAVPEVALAVAYGVPSAGEQGDVPVAAVVVSGDTELPVPAVTAALTPLAPHQRPQVVHVVDAIPMSDGFRLLRGPLRARGMPDGGLRWDAASRGYVAP